MRQTLGFRTLLAAALTCAALSARSASAQSFPGGATQVQEVFDDWRVTCTQPSGQKTCILTQQMVDKDSHQLVVGIDVKVTASDRAEGTMVLPFGLAVDKELVMQIDDSGMKESARVHTCLPTGCVVPFLLQGPTLSMMRRGTTLNVVAMAADADKEATFKVSLKGFSSSMDRAVQLTK